MSNPIENVANGTCCSNCAKAASTVSHSFDCTYNSTTNNILNGCHCLTVNRYADTNNMQKTMRAQKSYEYSIQVRK